MLQILKSRRAKIRVGSFAVAASFLCLSSSVQAQAWPAFPEIKAGESNASAMGSSVAIWANTALAGVPLYNTLEPSGLTDTGAVYVLKYDSVNNRWFKVQTLQPDVADRDDYESFGSALDMRENMVVVGSPEDTDPDAANDDAIPGAVYVFRRGAENQGYVLEQKITASDGADGDYFGYTVSTSVGSDGKERIVVGAFEAGNLSGAAYVYARQSNGQWTREAKFSAPSNGIRFGCRTKIQGDWIAISACSESAGTQRFGKVYLYKRNSSWQANGILEPSSRTAGGVFGWQVDMSDRFLFASERARNTGEDQTQGAGKVFVFEKNATNWSEVQVIESSDPNTGGLFGWDLAIDDAQAAIAIRSQPGGRGSIERYELGQNSQWRSVETLTNDALLLATSVDIYGPNLISGAPGVPPESVDEGNQGAVYVFGPAASNPSTTPAPVLGGSALALLGLGLSGFGLRRRKR